MRTTMQHSYYFGCIKSQKHVAYLALGLLLGILLISIWYKHLLPTNGEIVSLKLQTDEIWIDPCLGDSNSRRKMDLASAAECIVENNSIIFLETNPNFVSFHGRRLCAFESAARHNPNRTVVVVLPENITMSKDNILFMEVFPNLYIHHLDYTDIISRSPQAHLLEKIKEKETVNVHISDIMRPIVLSMYGGAYMDSDTVSLKPFPSDIKNFLVEDVKPAMDLNNGVLSFEKNNKFLVSVLEKMANSKLGVGYRNALGPPLMKSVRKKVCPARNYTIPDDRVHYYCPEVDALVLKRTQAHTWNTPHYTRLKGNMTLDVLMDGIKDSFVIHYFGGKYDKGKLKLKETSPLIGIMEEHCPTAVKIIKDEIKS